MARVPIQIAGGAYKARSSVVGVQRCVNLYPERQADGKDRWALYPTPGLVNIATLGAGPIRAMGMFRGKRIAVSGDQVYEEDTLVGSGLGTGPIRMVEGTNGLFICDGENGYQWNGVTFSTLTLPDNPGSCAFSNTYLLFLASGTADFYWSNAGGTTWDALDFDQASSSVDDATEIIIHRGELWIFGPASYEVWSFTGATPLWVRSTTVAGIGLAARGSLAVGGDTIAFLAHTGTGTPRMVAVDGYSSTRISTPEVEHAISTYASVDDAYGWIMSEGGHAFYVLTFPSGPATWVFDFTTGEWHERETYGLDRWLPSCHVWTGTEHHVGDPTSGTIYRVDADVYEDDGTPIRRLRRVRLPNVGGHNLFMHEFELRFQAGSGISSGQGSNPMAMLRMSRDGGRTWGRELWRSIGKIGEYRDRARWLRLGVARDPVVEVSVSDPVEVVMVDAFLDAEAGTS